MKSLTTTLILTALAFVSSPVSAAQTSSPQANKQVSVGTMFVLCEYDGEDLVVNWTVRPNLADTLISVVRGTIRFGTGATVYIGGVPEGIRVRGLPWAGDQEVMSVGPGLDPADAWVLAEAEIITVGLPPHRGTTPPVEVACDYLN
jgi:hypothetical protein